MHKNSLGRLTWKEISGVQSSSRREFLKKIAAAGSGLLIADRFLVRGYSAQTQGKKTVYSLVVADFNKCTGCRTCETVCASHNHKIIVNGKELPGLGNPYFSNIRVYPFNPDVDVPVICTMCDDAPCIAACPVEPDPQTGRRALFKDDRLPIIRNDLERCIGCGSCAQACREKRVGAIIPNPETNKPERMCTLCGGDPQCVKYCPFGALSHIMESTTGRYYGISADRAAKALARLWYGLD